MVLTTLFLVTASIMFTSGGGSPATEFFGRNLYLVKTDSFDLVKPPSVVVGEKTEPSELGSGDIVIFKNGKKGMAIGMVIETLSETFIDEATDEEIGEAVLTFKITDESGEVYVAPEEDIISKATKTSRVFGVIVNFAASPAGALVIAVIPCFLIVLWELLKPVFRKIKYGEEVPPIKKQDEVPTFIPEVPAPAKVKAKVKESDGDADSSEKAGDKAGKSAAALKAYKETLKTTNADAEQEPKSPDLFTSIPSRIKAETPAPKKAEPPSSVKLAETIALLNAHQSRREDAPKASGGSDGSGNSGNSGSIQELSAIEKARLIRQAMEETKKLKPQKGE